MKAPRENYDMLIKMMFLTIQQIAKSMEVVQDILIVVCTKKESSDKKEKMKEYMLKITENKENDIQIYQNQLEICNL